MEDLSDAKEAWQHLRSWISGFRRNSRNRPRGEDHYYDPQDRENYQRILLLHSRRRTLRQDVQPSSPPPDLSFSVRQRLFFPC